MQPPSADRTDLTASPEERGSEVINVEIGGMSCNNCATGIARRLETLDGVTNAQVSYALEDARIRFWPDRATPETIRAAIEDAGYQIRQQPSDPLSTETSLSR